MIPAIQRYRTITLRPDWRQFAINELPLLVLCPAGFAYAGMEDVPCTRLVLIATTLLTLCLAYRLAYLRRIYYHVGSEQLICEHGVFQKSVNYMELYRIVDFYEHQSLMQQLCGLKTVTVFSMDRTTPRLNIMGVKRGADVVSLIRERVEYNKQRKGIYEITNR